MSEMHAWANPSCGKPTANPKFCGRSGSAGLTNLGYPKAKAGTPLPQLQRVDTFWQNVLRGLFGSFQSRAGANSFEYGKLSDAAGRASERASSEGALIAEAPSAIGTRREREACSPRDSIVPGGGLRRRRALARQTEPRLCVGTLELG
jgi:hypothetical protein